MTDTERKPDAQAAGELDVAQLDQVSGGDASTASTTTTSSTVDVADLHIVRTTDKPSVKFFTQT